MHRSPHQIRVSSLSEVAAEHRASAPESVRVAVLTVSDTRTRENDTGGTAVVELTTAAGHLVAWREICPDQPQRIRSLVDQLAHRSDIDAVLLTGGTGLSSRDLTHETLNALFTKPLPGYGELFRMLSFAEVGPAAMLSRATAGLVGRTVVFSMPGSPAAVRLAMTRLIVPELAHLVREARR